MEWTVVTVLIALVGLGAAVMKPMISLNSTIVKLTGAVEALQKNIEEDVYKRQVEGSGRVLFHRGAPESRPDLFLSGPVAALGGAKPGLHGGREQGALPGRPDCD